MNRASALVGVALAVTVLSAGSNQEDWLLVPGVRAGPIQSSTSETDLQRLFGPQNVAPIRIYLGEGAEEPGTVVFPNDPTQRLEIRWRDTVARTSPREISVQGRRSRWHFANGVSLGTTLRELEHLNGAPFMLNGWEKEGAGIIYGWYGGALEADLPVRQVRFYLAEPTGDSLTVRELGQLIRDVWDTTRVVQRSNPPIIAIRLFLDR